MKASRVLKRSIDISRADGTARAVSPILLVNYARALRDVARLQEAEDYSTRANARARDQGNQVITDQPLIVLADVDIDLGRIDQAARLVAELEPRLQGNLPAAHIAFASLASEKSLIEKARGRMDRRWIWPTKPCRSPKLPSRLEDRAPTASPRCSYGAPLVELDLKLPNDALGDANHAFGILQSGKTGTYSSSMGRA